MTDESADLTEFVRRESAPLLAYLLKLGLPYHDAEDALAETLSRACEQWPYLGAPRAWSRTTALHLALDTLRRQRSDQLKQRRSGAIAPTAAAADELHMLKDEQRALIQHIRALPERQRITFALHLDGFANTEIATLLDLKAGTVASNLRHAKNQLRAALLADGTYRPLDRHTDGGHPYVPR